MYLDTRFKFFVKRFLNIDFNNHDLITAIKKDIERHSQETVLKSIVCKGGSVHINYKTDQKNNDKFDKSINNFIYKNCKPNIFNIFQ